MTPIDKADEDADMERRYLIIGNGVAGTTAAEAIRKKDPRGRITLVTEEDLPFYRRIQLNDFLAGELDEDGLVVHDQEWYAEQRIELLTATRVVDAPADRPEVQTAEGKKIPYDRLLLATGSHSFLPPVPGNDRAEVFTLRNIADARRISAFCREGQRAVLIGGGLLGLETGQALLKRGLKVTVAEMFPRLLPRQLDDKGAARLQGLLAERGFAFCLGVTVQEIAGDTGAGQVLLAGGVSLPADLVIFSAGVRPNLELARSLGLDCDKGVIVDNAMRTSRPEVFAAGDVAEFNGVSYGLWPAALQQGRAAGAAMAGEKPGYRGTAPAARLKVAGIDLAAAGEIDADHKYQAVVEESATVYRKFVTEQGRLIGFIMLGDTSDFNAMIKALAEGARYPG